MSPSLSLACTCGAPRNRDTACATCRAWADLRVAVEHLSAMARRSRSSSRTARLEQRMRAVEDALIANGIQ